MIVTSFCVLDRFGVMGGLYSVVCCSASEAFWLSDSNKWPKEKVVWFLQLTGRGLSSQVLTLQLRCLSSCVLRPVSKVSSLVVVKVCSLSLSVFLNTFFFHGDQLMFKEPYFMLMIL